MADAAPSFAANTMSDAADSPVGSDRGDRDGPARHDADGSSHAASDGSSDGPLETEQTAGAIGESIGGVEVDAPPIAPADLDEGQRATEIEAEPADETADDIETYAARRQRRAAGGGAWRWPLSRLQSGVLALLIVDAIIVGWRDEFVRILPQTASFYSMFGLDVNLRGLAFDGVNTATEQHDGVPVIVIDGNIVNESRKVADVPRLKFAVRNASGQEVYSWTTVSPRTSLPPGESVPFSSRLASPPAEAHDILVRFVTRHDLISGAR